MDPAIAVKGLGKCYTLGQAAKGFPFFQQKVSEVFQNSFLKNGKKSPSYGQREVIWALRDVSFEVKPGEVVGIIGRNGTGKSTLLKILSRITEPTEGKAELRGTVASLLEVGTGFHPDLTGRENIYLNGVLMGMKKKEIDGKFDEIVDFAEIEKFLDTPVKRYSTGMYLRLAFSVAAHLEAEILLVDEVLAVGDATFQEKCLGKIGDVAKGGRTVLFVSHNMASIVKLCNYALWIDNGRIRSNGLPEKAVQTYLTSNLFTSDGRVEFSEPENTKEVFIRSVDLRDQYGEVTPSFNIFSPIYVHVTFCCKRKFLNWRVFVSVTRYDGVVVFSTTTWDYNSIRYPVGPGVYHARLLIPGRFLGPASYLLTVAFNEPGKGRLDVLENILRFDIFGTAFDYGRNIGLLVYPFEWKVDGDQ